MQCPSCRAQNEDGLDSCFTCGAAIRASSADLVQGSVVASRYEILRLLGQGGMGRVFQAYDRVLDEIVALKTLRSDIAREPDVTRRFLSEIKLARRARHENVCAIHEYGEDGGLRFIAMEFIEGVDLRRLLRERGRLPPAEAFDVVVQVAQGLQAIHEAGIIHRDLKTPNIMRDTKGVVRLMDFGIAKHTDAAVTLGGQALGTPDYMSPEQARGQKVSFQTDIYALGVLTFEVFAGRVPFHGDTHVATILKHLNEAPPLEGEAAVALPREVVPVLAKALAKSPGDRYGSAQEMLIALQAAQAAYLGRGGSPARATRAQVSTGPGNSTTAIADQEDVATSEHPLGHADAVPKTSTTAATATMATPSPSSADQATTRRPARPSRLPLVLAGGGVAIALLLAIRARESETRSRTEPVASNVPTTARPPDRRPGPSPSQEVPAPQPSVVPTPAPPAPSPKRSPKAVTPAPPALEAAAGEPGATIEASPAPETAEASTPTPSPTPPEPTLPSQAAEIPRLDQVKPDSRNRGATYPREQHPAGTEVVVYLKVVLSEQGVVTDVNAISGAEPFATAAIEAAWAWRFAPPTVGGRPSAGFTILRVVVRPDGS